MTFILSWGAMAQGTFLETPEIPERQKFMVHYSLTQHLNLIRPSFRVGIENQISESLYLNAELGYIYKGSSRNFWTRSVFKRRGLHIGIEPKIYPYESHSKGRRSIYFSFISSFDKIYEDQNDFVPRAGGAYFQKMDYTVTEYTSTQMLAFGRTLIHSNPMNVDFYLGLGIRNSVVRSNDLPDDVNDEDIQTSFDFWSTGQNYRPAFQIGIFLTFPGIQYPQINKYKVSADN